MTMTLTQATPGREHLLGDLVGILKELTSDWDHEFSGSIGADTRLIADLAFESIDVVQLIVAIEEKYQRRDLPFEELLMVDGGYVEEIRVGELVDFLHSRLGRAGAAGPASADTR
jgi:acyl carrier protein